MLGEGSTSPARDLNEAVLRRSNPHLFLRGHSATDGPAEASPAASEFLGRRYRWANGLLGGLRPKQSIPDHAVEFQHGLVGRNPAGAEHVLIADQEGYLPKYLREETRVHGSEFTGVHGVVDKNTEPIHKRLGKAGPVRKSRPFEVGDVGAERVG